MYRLLIVDDDAMDRQGVRALALWDHLDIEVIGEAWNGKQALEMCLSMSPDIVITDIRMPIMDGLALTRALKREKPEVRVILASGYEDFSAARQALHIGAAAYLVKPIRRDELKDTMQEVIHSLNGARIHNEEDEQLRQRLSALLPLERERFLHEAILGVKNLVDPIAAQEAKLLGLMGCETYVLLALVWMDGAASSAEVKRKRMLYAHDAIIKEAASHDEYPPIALESGLYALVLRPSSMLDEEQLFSYVDGFARDLVAHIREASDLDVVVGISTAAQDLLTLNAQYEQAHYAVRSKALHGMNRAIWYEEEDDAQPPALSIDAYVDQLVNFMLMGDAQAFDRFTYDFLAGISKAHRDDAYVKALSIAAVARLATTLSRSGKDMRDAFPEMEIPYQTILERIMRAESIAGLQTYLAGLFVQIMNALFTHKHTRSRTIVEKAIDILNEEYAGNISAEELAKRLYITPSHLRRLFKNQTRNTVQEYVLALRMTKARELLFNLDLKVNEVASMVGYENNSYFCMIFKRYYGTTPTEYRNV